MAANRVLVIDDDEAVRFGVREFLEAHGFRVDEADTGARARGLFRAARPDAVILDYRLPDGHALDLLTGLKEIDPDVPLVVLTGYGSIDLAVQAVKQGADQFLTKPVELSSLLVVLQRLLEARRDRRRLAGRSLTTRDDADPFLGVSDAIGRLAEQARQVVSAESSILIRAETGTGKGVLARWLHHHGPRKDEAFVDLNCAGLSPEFLESELFGHEKGAFTGAVARKLGLLEVGHRGTVFLDEVGDMPAEVQPKLLKVLEEKRFRRLGDVEDRGVDVRLIAATHQDLGTLIREKRFRSDLYFRVNTIPLEIPPLRERPEDIPVLARWLVERLAGELGRGEVRLSEEAVTVLQRYPWPGNVRELRNVLERALLLVRHPVVGPGDLLFDGAARVQPVAHDTTLTLQEVERTHIERVLLEEGGHVERAAARLGIPRSSLYQKVKRFNLAPVRSEKPPRI